MYIKDTYTGKVRKYGADHHDSLRISSDGTFLTYENLQCGDGSIEGDKEHSGFLFCDEDGLTPEEDEVLVKHGADAYFNIGGWDKRQRWIPVSERLPEEDDRYLVTLHDNFLGNTILILRYSHNLHELDEFDFPNEERAGWCTYDNEWGFVEYENVIAWMPLPAPYKAESEVKNDAASESDLL